MVQGYTGVIQSGAKPEGVIEDIVMGARSLVAQEPDEQKLAQTVLSLFQKARQWKAIWAKDHERWWDIWEGNYWKGRIVKTIEHAVVNQVWSSIETMLAHILDALPEPIARPRSPAGKAKAKLVTKWLRYETDQTELEAVTHHPIRSACVTGAGWYKVGWDWLRQEGHGDVSIDAIDEKYVFVSPYAKSLKEALYVIEAKNVPRDWVKRAWPEMADKLPAGPTDGTLWNVRPYDEPQAAASAPTAALVTTTTKSDSRWVNSAQIPGGPKKTDLVTLIEAWIRQESGELRYVVLGNGVVLQDGPSPFADDDFPYAVVNILPTLDTIQGRGLVQFIEGLQDLLNKTLSMLLDQQRFEADPMLAASSSNLEDAQLLENSPGSVLPDANLAAGQGQGYYWIHGPGFNQGWLQIQQVVVEYMDSVLGRVDVLKGERPAGVNTLGGLEIIRDEANVRVRSLIRWVRASLKRVYKLVLSRLRQFATDERSFRVMGKMGAEDFVTVNPATGVGPDGGLVQDLTIPQDVEFDVEFGKDVPGGRQAELELALTLAGTPAEDGLPMVDRAYVLEKAIDEEAPEVLARMQQQAMIQQQALAAQGPQAPGAVAGPQVPPERNPMDVIQELFAGAA